MSQNSNQSGQNFQGNQPNSFGPPVQPMGMEPMEEESLRNIFRVLSKRRREVIFWVVGMVAIALLVCLVMSNQYTATATLLVEDQNASGFAMGGLGNLASAMTGGADLQTEMQTHAAVLQSDTTALAVVHKTGLDKFKPYKYVPGILDKCAPGIFGWNSQIKAEIGLPLERAPATRERMLKIIDKRLDVEPQSNTRLVTVAFRDYNPQRAADVANAFVNVYIHEYLETHFHATAEASDWLTGQLDQLKANVADSQKKLSDYERQTGLSVLMLGMSASSGSSGSGGAGAAASMTGGTQIPALAKLALLNQELTSAESDLIAKEAIYHLTQTQSPEVVLGLGESSLASISGSAVISSGQGLTVLQNLRQQQAALRVAYGDAETKYGANNPHLAEMQGQMRALDQSISEELKRINERAKNDVELSQKTKDGLQKDYEKQEAEVNKLNDSMVELEILADNALSNRVLYEQLFSSLQQANIQAGVSATNLDLVDIARPPAQPSRPDWLIYPGVAFAIGLVVGIVFALIRENMDDLLVTTEQVEKVGRLPVLSYIPLPVAEKRQPEKEGEGEAGAETSLLITRSNSPSAEAYRALRTSIVLSTVDSPLKVLLITSPLGGDGKTTISYNVAVAFAQHGQRVLLVDCDMRKPAMNVLFHTQKAPGLSEVLTGGLELESVLRPHATLDNLFLVPSGTIPPNPAELLSSRRFKAFLEEAKQQFDLVMLDSPPVLMVTDPVIMSTEVDGTILVVRSKKTKRPVLKRTMEVLSQSYGRKLGIVVNCLDTKSVEYYYSYGYYGDNKYYGEEA